MAVISFHRDSIKTSQLCKNNYTKGHRLNKPVDLRVVGLLIIACYVDLLCPLLLVNQLGHLLSEIILAILDIIALKDIFAVC